MTLQILDKRVANALFKDAKMSQDAAAAIGRVAGALGAGAKMGLESAHLTLDRFASRYGGLWVGGRASLTDTMLMFEPNALNRMIHENGETLRLDLPLEGIERVETRFGWFTGIIDVTAGGAVFSLRCYGSKTFAAKIEAARASVAQ